MNCPLTKTGLNLLRNAVYIWIAPMFFQKLRGKQYAIVTFIGKCQNYEQMFAMLDKYSVETINISKWPTAIFYYSELLYILQWLWRESCKWLLRISQQIYMGKMTYGKKIDLFPQQQMASFLRLFISNLILKALGAIICSGAWHSRSNYLNQFNFWWLTH